MGSEEFLSNCKELVRDYTNNRLDETGSARITDENVYVVWSVKVLQNSKALLSTTLFDGMYYEVTLNGDKDEIYFDAYSKTENKVIEI